MIGGVIDGHVITRLKETHLANFFGADPRGSDVSDRAGGKFDTGVCSVHSVRNDRNADSVYARSLDLITDKPLHNVQIVNHQVEYDIDIQRARGELTNAVNFEIYRMLNVWPQGDERRVETLSMADLKYG